MIASILSKKVLFPFTTKNFSLKSWNKHRYTINISSDTFCRCTMIEFGAYTNTYLHEVSFGNLYKYNNTKRIHMSCNIALLFHFNNQMISYLKKSRVNIKYVIMNECMDCNAKLIFRLHFIFNTVQNITNSDLELS